MTILEAISVAKETGDWRVTPGEAVSVNIEFTSRNNNEDETQLDLYSENKESELATLWESLEEEFEAIDVNRVYSLEYLAE